MEIQNILYKIAYQEGDTALQKFYDKLQQKIFATTKCTDCNTLFFPPKTICPNCYSNNLQWENLSGEATLYAFTQHDRSLSFHPPSVIGLVELKEGFKLLTHIKGNYNELKIGDKLRLDFFQIKEGFFVHCFCKAK